MTRILTLVLAVGSLILASCECCKSKKNDSCCKKGAASTCCPTPSKSDTKTH